MTLSNDSAANFFCGFAGGLADGGLFVDDFDPEKPRVGDGAEVDVRIAHRRIRARARVAWVRSDWAASDGSPPGVGLTLLDLSEDDRALVEAFMQRRDPLFFMV